MSDWNKNLAKEIAKGLINTGIEGGYDSVAKSTAYDYPSISDSPPDSASLGLGCKLQTDDQSIKTASFCGAKIERAGAQLYPAQVARGV